MRRTVVAANWKMNKTPSEAAEFLNKIKPDITGADCDVMIFPPFLSLANSVDILKDTDVYVGVQNLYYEESGAFTGEVSASMIKDAGAKSVIIGHSERREYFGETDEIINLKLKKALEHKLIPVLCCGESLEIRESGSTNTHITSQIKKAFDGISEDLVSDVIVAYEPIWAIGTGRVATSDQAQEVCALIRNTISELYGESVANDMRILYGGSVNNDNFKELFAQPDIDGGLIGGAGLKPEFTDIVKGA